MSLYQILNEEFFKEFDKGKKFNLEYGGSGSGKSISIAQYFVQGLISGDGYRRAILRKSFPSMKLTTYLIIKAILKDWGIKYEEHKTDHYFEVGTNRLYYISLDDPDKIKGGEFKELWLEEATEFTEADFNQLTIRLARDKHSEDARFFLSFNPIEEQHWVVKKINYARLHPEDWNVHHSTYSDNVANLSQNFIKQLQDLINVDENFYKIYTLGEPGILKNRIYSHFSIENSALWNWQALIHHGLHAYGLDFGYNHPMALIEGWIYENEIYLRELYYKTERTTDDLAIWMEENGISHSDYIYADSAEPDRIDTLCTSRTITTKYAETESEISMFVPGFNVQKAEKDVKAGIDFIKGKKVHVCAESINLIKEYNTYRYKETKDGNVIDEPIKINDDSLDAARYMIYSLAYRMGMPLDLIKDAEQGVGFTIYDNQAEWDMIYES